MDEQDIEINNKLAELAALKIECLEKSKELTETHRRINTEKENFKNSQIEEKLKYDKYCKDRETEIQLELDRLADRIARVEMRETTTKQLASLQNELKVANKELSLTNGRVLKAREEFDSISMIEKEVTQKVSEMTELVVLLPQIQSEILSLEGKRNSLKIEISEMLDSSILELSQAKESLKLISEDVIKKTEEANQAEYRYKKFTDDLVTHEYNYDVVKSRLEKVYRQKFPELVFKI